MTAKWVGGGAGGGTSGTPAVIATPRSGSTYAPYMPGQNIGNVALGNGVLAGAPIEFGVTVTLSALMSKAVVAGTAGSVVRLGIYTNVNSRPGALVVDAGTIDGTNTSDASIAISQTLAAGVYWFVAVSQGAPTTDPQTRSTNPAGNGVLTDGFLGNPAGTPYVGGYSGYSTSGITGALPASLTAATWTGTSKTYLVFPKVA